MIAGIVVGIFKMLLALVVTLGLLYLLVKRELLDVFFEMGQTPRSAFLVIVGLCLFFWGVWGGLVWMMW